MDIELEHVRSYQFMLLIGVGAIHHVQISN